MYQSIFHEGKENQPLVIALHGTGGTENDLVPVAKALLPDASILGIRGDVNENGMARYFKRKAEGVYDVEDLNQRGQNLYQFIQDKVTELNKTMEDVILLGFSNGSNIGINLLIQEDSQINKGMLFAPMYPVDLSENKVNLNGTHVFLSMGENDPIAKKADSENVIQLFEKRGANVSTFWVNSHEVTQPSLVAAKDWLEQL